MKRPVRITLLALAALCGAVLALTLSDAAIGFATAPLTDRGITLNLISLIDGFMLRLKAAGIVFIMLAHPFVTAYLARRATPGTPALRGVAVPSIAVNLAFYAGAFLFFRVVFPRICFLLMPDAHARYMLPDTLLTGGALAWLVIALCVDALVLKLSLPAKTGDGDDPAGGGKP